jgi:aminoglycoside phosphotransferase (APT) family kinase protein
VKRLTGGITSAVHLLTVEDAHGQRHRAVLRRWMESEHTAGAEWVRREAQILEQLSEKDIPAPRVFRIDPTGSSCGSPALLMSHLPGRMELNPSNSDLWLERYVAMLVRIHKLDLRAPEAESWLNRNSLVVPTWTTQPELWRDAIALMDEKPPEDEQTFIHHDYQHFNLLWQRGRISGVVDWVFGSMGSPSMDVLVGPRAAIPQPVRKRIGANRHSMVGHSRASGLLAWMGRVSPSSGWSPQDRGLRGHARSR